MKARLLMALLLPLCALLLIGVAFELRNAGTITAGVADRRDVLAVANNHVATRTALTTFTTEVIRINDNHALIKVVPTGETGDPALMVLQRSSNGWQVVLGPQTSFEPQELKELNIPESLFN